MNTESRSPPPNLGEFGRRSNSAPVRSAHQAPARARVLRAPLWRATRAGDRARCELSGDCGVPSPRLDGARAPHLDPPVLCRDLAVSEFGDERHPRGAVHRPYAAPHAMRGEIGCNCLRSPGAEVGVSAAKVRWVGVADHRHRASGRQVGVERDGIVEHPSAGPFDLGPTGREPHVEWTGIYGRPTGGIAAGGAATAVDAVSASAISAAVLFHDIAIPCSLASRGVRWKPKTHVPCASRPPQCRVALPVAPRIRLAAAAGSSHIGKWPL